MSRASISIRELRRNLEQVLQRVERGETINVTRRGRLVAQLGPCVVEHQSPPWSNLEERARALFGDRLISPSASDAVREGRGDHALSGAAVTEDDQTSAGARAALFSQLRAEAVTNIGRWTRGELYEDDL